MQPEQVDVAKPPHKSVKAPAQTAVSYATDARVDLVESRMATMKNEFETEIRALRAEVYEQKCDDAHAARHLGLGDFLAAAEEGQAATAMGPEAARAAKQPPNAEEDDEIDSTVGCLGEEDDNGRITEAATAERQLIDTQIEEFKKSDQAGLEMTVAEAQARITALERAVAKVVDSLSVKEEEAELMRKERHSDQLLTMYVLQGSKNGQIVNLNISSVGRV
jgi:hypothetical protein